MERKTYTYDEAYDATLRYFDGDELAARVWVTKYALKDSFGNLYEQTPTICTTALRRRLPASRPSIPTR